MPTDALEQKEFMPPRQKRAALPGPSSRTIGRLRTVTDETGYPLVRDMGTYWAPVTGGANLPWFNVKDFGALGDGSTDDTTALNTAIAAANAVAVGNSQGMILYFPTGVYKVSSQLTSPSYGVRLIGVGWGSGTASHMGPSVIKTTWTDSTKLFDLGSSATGTVWFENLSFVGVGAGATNLSSHAIFATYISGLYIKHCFFDYWGGSAVRIDDGINIILDNVGTEGHCLQGLSTAVSRVGVIHIGALEVRLWDCGINGSHSSQAASGYGSGYETAIYITGSPVRAFGTVGAFAQNGWWLSGISSPSALYGCRSEFNQGHGFVIDGNEIHLTDCSSFQNGRDTDNTYDAFWFKDGGNQGRCTLTSCVADSNTSTRSMRYYLTDDQGNGDANWRPNKVTNPIWGPNTHIDTNGWLNKSNSTPIVVTGGVPYHQTITDAAPTTINAALGDYWDWTAAASRTVSAPTLGYKGQRVVFAIKNGSGGAMTTTFNGAFKMAGYTDPANGKTVVLTLECYDGTNWKLCAPPTGDLTI